MKKTFLFSIISCVMFAGTADATVCKLIPTTCYTNMGAGYLYDVTEPASWDITSNCWGKKYICTDALTDEYINSHNTNESVALGRKEIPSAVKSDFDVTMLDGDCFGARKIKDGGAMVSVGGKYVNVWCTGILDAVDITPDDILDNGEITLGAQPECNALAQNGYVNIKNGKCYGKYYNQNTFRIQCENKNPTLIILNGADPDTPPTSDIRTNAQATTLFNTMYHNAQAQHRIYFNN